MLHAVIGFDMVAAWAHGSSGNWPNEARVPSVELAEQTNASEQFGYAQPKSTGKVLYYQVLPDV